MVAHLDSNDRKFGYAASAFYRQYQSINNRFCNLVEAQRVTLFQKRRTREGLYRGARHSRHAKIGLRSIHFLHYDLDDYSNLFRQNPVTHPIHSSLSPARFNDYTFWMDTTDYPGYYLVHYRCEDYSSDNHGVSNFFDFNRHGAAREEGTLKIDKAKFRFNDV